MDHTVERMFLDKLHHARWIGISYLLDRGISRKQAERVLLSLESEKRIVRSAGGGFLLPLVHAERNGGMIVMEKQEYQPIAIDRAQELLQVYGTPENYYRFLLRQRFTECQEYLQRYEKTGQDADLAVLRARLISLYEELRPSLRRQLGNQAVQVLGLQAASSTIKPLRLAFDTIRLHLIDCEVL